MFKQKRMFRRVTATVMALSMLLCAAAWGGTAAFAETGESQGSLAAKETTPAGHSTDAIRERGVLAPVFRRDLHLEPLGERVHNHGICQALGAQIQNQRAARLLCDLRHGVRAGVPEVLGGDLRPHAGLMVDAELDDVDLRHRRNQRL